MYVGCVFIVCVLVGCMRVCVYACVIECVCSMCARVYALAR